MSRFSPVPGTWELLAFLVKREWKLHPFAERRVEAHPCWGKSTGQLSEGRAIATLSFGGLA
jgi:hypothetical protein